MTGVVEQDFILLHSANKNMTNDTELTSRIAQTRMTPPIFYQYYRVMTSQEHHMLKKASQNVIKD